ncbi:Uncharacterised protein [Mycobacteroides abscessus subsp. abscessus]|nr:Uncharacterised protein [Mycobacteroides abscessus subsp. abscessus]
MPTAPNTSPMRSSLSLSVNPSASSMMTGTAS